MKEIKVLFPINQPEDIKICEKVNSKKVYISHKYFINNGFEKLFEFEEMAKKYKVDLYISFSSDIYDKDNVYIKDFLNFIENQNIKGILVNSFSILEFLKLRELQCEVIIDSDINIHNVSAIEFIQMFNRIDYINIGEEIYLKNIAKIKKTKKIKLCINTNNLPWIAEDILKSKTVEMVILKADLQNAKEIYQAVSLIEKMLVNPKIYKNKKLPFKIFSDGTYETNHFTGEFLSNKGKDFKFSGNIKPFDWDYKRTRLSKNFNPDMQLPKLCLRMNSLLQIKALKAHIKKLGFNPVDSIEYGEILNTVDLSKKSFNMILDIVKDFCAQYDIKLKLGTPKTLIERDFDRVYEYVKQLFEDKPPHSMIINNIGFWWTVINDPDYEKLPIELGPNLNLTNGESILCLSNQRQLEAVELSHFVDIRDIEACLDTIKDDIPTRKLAVAGSMRIPCSGLCPLNTDSAVLSRLSCPAPCQLRRFAITDKDRNKSYTILVDGFCRMHLYRDRILDLFKYMKKLQEIGVNEFVIDFNALSSKLVPVLLNRYLNALCDEDYKTDEHFLDKLYYLNYYY